MSGVGQRFIDAGYKTPKPLIEIDGKTIIEHVCDLFPGEEKFTFICNSKHLAETEMRQILRRIKPKSNIIEIPMHKKGPVYAVTMIQDLIDDFEEVIINYCDFGTYWDYTDFLRHTRSRLADGAIPSYKGFHPHMLGTTNYAFIREDKQWLKQIKEKEPFTKNRMNEFASNGTYYFKKGKFVKKYFKKLIRNDINLNGEFYVSLVYNLMVEDNLSISVYNIQHMLQWGTPSDVEEYKTWSKYFSNVLINNNNTIPKNNSTTLIPLAGRGSRFSNLGYKDPKPLIKVSGKPMIIQAANSLPKSNNNIFVTLEEHLKNYPLENVLTKEYPNSKIISINEVTEGQAITCSLGLNDADKNNSLLIAATDNGMLFNSEDFESLTNDLSVDAIIFTFRNHVSSNNNPHMYGWVRTINKNDAVEVSVKTPISDNPFNDHAIVGTFWFRNVDLYNIGLKKMINDNIRVNNEFYVDSLMGVLIKLKYKIKIFEVNDYICWGTPNDYQTFNYWQSFFHKVSWHPYKLESDPTVNKSEIGNLDRTFRKFKQKFI